MDTLTPNNKTLPYLHATLIFLFALALRLLYVNHTVHFDEFYHVLAARAFLTDGTLRIAPGSAPYDRAWLFTYIVALSQKLLGQSIWASRLPSVLFGALLVLALFLWLRRTTGRLPATLAALALALAPYAIDFSQMARFYMLQSLCLFLAAISLYELLTRPHSLLHRAALALSFLLTAAIALHLQASSVVALAALALWAAALITHRLLHPQSPDQLPRNRRLLALLVAAALLALAIAFLIGIPQNLWHTYRHVALWAQADQNNIAYYHHFLLGWYPILWVLFPFAVIAALATAPAPAAFCFTIFAFSFLATSFGGFKAPRYFDFAMPFFFALWAIALAPLLRTLYHQLISLAAQINSAPLCRRAASVSAALFLLLATLFVLHNTPAYSLTRRMLTTGEQDTPFRQADWAAATPLLKPLADDSDLIITSANLKALYYLNRADVGLSATQLELEGNLEFATDWRINRPVITTPDSLRKLLSNHPTGLIVIESIHWRNPAYVNAQAADFIDANTQPIDLPKRSGLLAFRWNNTTPAPASADSSNTTAP